MDLYTMYQEHAETRVLVEPDADGVEQKYIVGMGIVYDTWSPVYWGFQERVQAGAATEALQGADIRGSFNHSDDILLARNNGTMELTETPSGVRYRILIDEQDSDSLSTYRKVLNRKVTGSSFTFRVEEEELERIEMEDGTEVLRRTIVKLAELREMGPVTYPFYPTTDSQVRTAPDQDIVKQLFDKAGRANPLAGVEAANRLQKQREMETTEIYKRSIEACR